MDDYTLLKQLLDNRDADEFLRNASELDPSFWEAGDKLKILTDAITLDNRGLKDFVYRILLSLDDESKSYASGFLVKHLYDKNLELRNLVADLLMKFGTNANEYLLPLLEDIDVDVQKFASDILGFSGTDKEIPNLVNLLNAKDMNVFTSAIESIGRIYERHSEQIGLGDLMIDKLTNIYNHQNYDTQPVIIEAIAKIGGDRAVDFLIYIIKTEEDLFLKTNAIDGLSICGNSEEICVLLKEQLHTFMKELQPVVLKTIIAISFRVGCSIDFEESFRDIALVALEDSDPDIRTAGLLALGNTYTYQDLSLIAGEYHKSGDEIKLYILNNFVANNINLLSDFIVEFARLTSSADHCYGILEMISNIRNFIDDYDTETQSEVIKVFISNLGLQLEMHEYDVFENLRMINEFVFDNILEKMASEAEGSIAEQISDLQNYLRN
ncbi:MAG: HEAT repeat domain-containing protein [Candidatus Kapabacteria bacterium]|nr:HEAT repeat domain-containing protein [Ignavibacteriota bacterium]MCW5884622.1 HEAT repeat domain-containing protein [Candidatus Kapabacteria bacterium]